MKVLAVIGSPRQGHSYELVRRIERLLCKDGDVKLNVVLLGKLSYRIMMGWIDRRLGSKPKGTSVQGVGTVTDAEACANSRDDSGDVPVGCDARPSGK